MRKSLVILFSFILMSSFFISGIYAQDAADTNVDGINEFQNFIDDEAALNNEDSVVSEEPPVISEEEQKVEELVQEAEGFSEELSVGAGITPDSGLYFVEKNILAPFRDDSTNREKQIAGMRELAPRCGQGDQKACESMQESFSNYRRYAGDFERGVSPEQRDMALESSRAIRGEFVRNIAKDVPAQYKDDMVREIVLGEKDISNAAEIAGKIKELCQQLSKLDPNEYSRVCSSGRDAPDWQKRLDKDLTEEQRQEALNFGKVMAQCFETAGQNCECEKISFPDFAEACSIAAPLATACEIENNEEACEQLDNLEMPELPEHLEDIFNELERGMGESKYGMFLPKECEEAGATDPKACAKIMIGTHAPEECRQALLDANVQSEGEGRKICEKIMFELNAPPECVEAGITNMGECGKIMFAQNAPRECVEAGIDGTGRNDPQKCQQIMESKFRPQGEFGGPPSCKPGTICGPGGFAPGTGPDRQMSGGNCAGIQDSEERLKCYDGAKNYVQTYNDEYTGNFGERQIQQRQCAENCGKQNSAWDFKDGNCVCKAPDFQQYQQQNQDQFRQDFNQQYNQQYGDFKDGQYYPSQQQGQFQPPQGQDYQQYNQQPGSYPQPPEGYQYPQPPEGGFQQPPEGYVTPEPTISGAEPYSMGGSAEPTTTTEPASTSSSEPAPSSEQPSPVTGGVISNNNFLRFWFLR